ncbi:hypothetical protein JKP88DRAFT_350464 [Tribonema minus]|uniref:Uncharacterized protein n=1 Tax=Tribonema minus TaxID=303371 RepID=A0A836CBD9_9STRA|nr:hypothetical protein JKP88DRAFT_350464 [Tribonema minus]
MRLEDAAEVRFRSEQQKQKGNIKAVSRAVRVLNNIVGSATTLGDMFGQVSSPPVFQHDDDFDDADTETAAALSSPSDALPDASQSSISVNVTGINGTSVSVDKLKRVATRGQVGCATVIDGPFTQLEEYMQTPVSQYSTLDDKLITRLDDETFRLAVPLASYVGLDLTPTVDVAVDTSAVQRERLLRMHSLGSTLYGTSSDTAALGKPQVLAPRGWGRRLAQQERRRRQRRKARITEGKPEWFEVSFEAKVRWSEGMRRDLMTEGAFLGLAQRNATAEGACTLACGVDVEVAVVLPPPFSKVMPRGVVGGAMRVVLRAVLSALAPALLSYLAQDYERRSGMQQRSTPLISHDSSVEDAEFDGEVPNLGLDEANFNDVDADFDEGDEEDDEEWFSDSDD